MRGKESPFCEKPICGRITPAYAGKRKNPDAGIASGRDHPRVCGEKTAQKSFGSQVIGSPPRMRGKATILLALLQSMWDHPRVCGEKLGCHEHDVLRLGSPPRMRGKAILARLIVRRLRITPAYAGKRLRASTLTWQRRDHPRVCGEKIETVDDMEQKVGSPPRMRGKD